ncbi:MAG: hypothetical protein ACRDNG_07265 [Gaiellaceae bacterium]
MGAKPSAEHAGERGACHPADVRPEGVERARSDQLVPVDEPSSPAMAAPTTKSTQSLGSESRELRTSTPAQSASPSSAI